MPVIYNPRSVNFTRDVYVPMAASIVATRKTYQLTNSYRWIPANPFAVTRRSI